MLLAIDIGNTNITLGVFENSKLVGKFNIKSDKKLPQEGYERLFGSILKKYKISGCIISSVVNELDDIVRDAVDNVFQAKSVSVSANMNLGITLDLQNNKEVGADRIANACGAYFLYDKPSVTVDLGTAVTFDIIDRSGVFRGGVIMPGPDLQFRVLNSCTSKLPRLKAEKIENVIGKNTKDSMLSGVIRGSVCAIEGLISLCEKEIGEKAVIIATGGYSGLISEHMTRRFDFVNPDLTLEGLNFLYKLNSPDKSIN